MWADLIETLGFYPYIQKNSSDLKIMSFADDVRMSYFKSDFLKNTYLHKEQKKISNYLLSGKNIIARACLKNKNCTKRMFHFPFS